MGGVCGYVLRSAGAVVRFPDGAAAIGVAMTSGGNEPHPGTLTLALESLDAACRDLDEAVLTLPNVGDDDFMVSSSVVALLLRVVTARRLVKRLQLEVKTEIRNRLRTSTLS
jgi:hypothetical protein